MTQNNNQGGYRRNNQRDDGDYRHSNTYRNGVTSYERPKGARGRGSNPYRRSNMIYAPKRRRWPIVVLILVLLAAAAGITFFACHAQSQPSDSSTQQTSTDSTATQQASTDTSTSSTDTSGTDSSSSTDTSSSTDERSATSTSKNDTKPTDKVVYLTFDDGPSDHTHKILDILDKYGVKATWFVIAKSTHPEYMKDIWARGNQIALHSYSHEYEQIYASTSAYWNDIAEIGKVAKKYLGFTPTLFRFPGGSVNDYNTAISKQLRKQSYTKGYHYFDWNVSSGDAAGNGVAASKLVANVKKESKGIHSACVLMHDTEAKATTVDALPQIIEYYQKKGFKFEVLTADSFGYHFQKD